MGIRNVEIVILKSCDGGHTVLGCVAVKFLCKNLSYFPHSLTCRFVIFSRRRAEAWNWKNCMTVFTGIAIFI